MRILHVLDTCGAGGIETTFLNILRHWRTQPPWAEHDVVAVAGGALEAAFREVTGSVVIAPTSDAMMTALHGEYDAVYVLVDRMAYRWLPFLAASSRAALVYGKGYDLAGTFRVNDGVCWQPDESAMWGCDQVTYTTATLAAGYAVPDGRTAVIGKAADVRHFLDVAPIGPGTPTRIVSIANLHALKRLGDLMHAVARLRPSHHDVRLRLVGLDASGEGARLRAVASSLGIEGACEIVGRHVDVAPDLHDALVFALPSSREGLPTAMLEAMAAARPVVVTDVGHVRTVVRDGVDGFIVPVGDIDALTDRLDVLLRDRRLTGAMGQAGRQRAAAHDVGTVANRLRDVLMNAGRGMAAGAAA